MSYIKKPVARHPSLKPNKLGLTIRDYEGSMSTLCNATSPGATPTPRISGTAPASQTWR